MSDVHYVYVCYSIGGPLSEAVLMAIIAAPPDDPAREHGLTLHKVERVRRTITPPTPTLNVSGSDDEDVLFHPRAQAQDHESSCAY